MSEKKIDVDMNLFKIHGKTRKKREKNEGGIKVKSASEKKKKETLKKRSILNMIRKHQEDRYKKIFDEKKEERKDIQDTSFNNEFKEAQQYLQSLADKKTHSLNTTIRNYKPDAFKDASLASSGLSSITNMVDNTNKILPTAGSMVSLNPSLQNIKTPMYGCLKNGSLPTYKAWMNNTRKRSDGEAIYTYPTINNVSNILNPGLPTIINGGEPVNNSGRFSQENDNKKLMETKIDDSIKRIGEMKEATSKLQQLKNISRPRQMKRKKTYRRTYKLGKSKNIPKIAVLVSNKTIRNNISTKSQLLKQVSIEEVKKFLINRGLIKVGSVTPNDVLRKMYESAVMMCGEVYNHSPENLLYNFINDK